MITLFGALLLGFIFLLLAVIYWYSTIPQNLPPGPLGLPFIGSTFSLRNGRTQDLVLQKYAQEYGPLFKLYVGTKLVIVLADYDIIQEALVKQGDAFTGRIQFNVVFPERIKNKGIVAAEGQLWKEQRRFALSVLRDLGLGRPVLEPQIKEEVESLITHLGQLHGKPVDPMQILIRSVFSMILRLVFGQSFVFSRKEMFVEEVLKGFERLRNAALGVLSPVVLSKTISEMLRFLPVVKEFKKENDRNLDIFEEEIADAKTLYDYNSEPTSFVHAFIRASQDGKGDYFDDGQLLAAASDLFGAGTFTTATTLCWALLYLGHNPDVQEKMYEEIRDQIGTSHLPSFADRTKLPYTEAVMMEVQRCCNLMGMGVMRRTVMPCKLMGYDIPDDTAVVALLTNVLHNKNYYPEPYKFRPARFLDSDGKNSPALAMASLEVL